MTPAPWLDRRSLLISGCVFLCSCGSGDVSPGPSPPVPPVSPPPPLPPPPPPPAPNPPPVVRLDFDFSVGPNGWNTLYSDYIVGQESRIAFESRFAALPPPFAPTGGYLLSSNNESDDVWMFIFREITGLSPNQSYRMDIAIRIATNGGRQCAGIGGSPGESVIVKAGGVPIRPATRIERGNYVAVNFDKGVQTVGSPNVPVIGDFTSSSPICTDTPYEIKTLSTSPGGAISTSDANGSLWVVIGTDSGFEGRTAIYYLSGSALLTPV